MTREQRKLLTLLTRENKLSRDLKEPYIYDDNKAFEEIAAAIDDDSVEGIIAEYKTAEDGNSGHIELLLWTIYMHNGGAHGKALNWGKLRGLLYALIEQNSNFIKVSQNKITNAFPALFNADLQIDLEGNATANVKGVNFEIKGFTFGPNGKLSLRTQTRMLFDAFLNKYYQVREPSITMPLKEYAELRGKKTTPDALKELRKEVVEDLTVLKFISAQCSEKIKGKRTPSGYIGLCGGTAFIKNGIIYFNFNPDLTKTLNVLAPLDYSKETLKADPRTSVYYFSHYIDRNFRRNEGKKRQNIISVRTLLETTPNIPKIEDIKRAYVKQRIIQPFFRDLDRINRILYTVVDEKKNVVEDPLKLDYDTFIGCSIIIENYDEYPQHPERIKKRELKKKPVQKKGGEQVAKGGGTSCKKGGNKL